MLCTSAIKLFRKPRESPSFSKVVKHKISLWALPRPSCKCCCWSRKTKLMRSSAMTFHDFGCFGQCSDNQKTAVISVGADVARYLSLASWQVEVRITFEKASAPFLRWEFTMMGVPIIHSNAMYLTSLKLHIL